MSISCSDQRVKDYYILELEKLIIKSKEIYSNIVDLFTSLNKYKLEKVETMIIDSALKGISLHNLNKQLLILPDKYFIYIIHLVSCFIDLFQYQTPTINRIIKI